MKDFKAALDAVRAAIEKVNTICDQMETAFTGQSDEEVQRALDMTQELEAAQERVNKLQAAYDLMIKSSSDEKSPASKFVPVGEAARKQAEAAKQKTRAEFDALSAADQMSFMLGDGKIIEE